MKNYILPFAVIIIATAVYFFKPKGMTESTLSEVGSQQALSNPAEKLSAGTSKAVNVAMEKDNTNVANSSRRQLLELIAVSRQAQNRPELEEQVTAARTKINQLPNKEEVLWSYYQELRDKNAEPWERAEVLDLFSPHSPDSKLAEAALQESTTLSTEPILSLDDARTQEEMNEALSTKEEWVPTLVSFEVFINNCGNYNSCRPGIDAVMGRHRNRNIRTNLIEIIAQKFPEEAHQMNP